MTFDDDMYKVRIPLSVAKENTIKIIGLFFNILDSEVDGANNAGDSGCTITIKYDSSSILAIHKNLDVKILKCILYYMKINHSKINLIYKQFECGDIMYIDIQDNAYDLGVSSKYRDLMNTRVKLLETCRATNFDSISTIYIEDADRDLLIDSVSRRIIVQNCEGIDIRGTTVNIIQSVDLLIIIDIEKIYIIDLYNDFKSKRIALENAIVDLVKHKYELKEKDNMEFHFI